MIRRLTLSAAGFATLAALAFSGCGENETDLPRLEFPSSMPSALKAGDTTVALTIIKFSADARGREQKNEAYGSFQFESSDSSVIKVVSGRRLLGLKAGSSSVTAVDNASDARTRPGRSITVQ